MEDEVAKKKAILEKSISDGALLETLKGQPGWELYEEILKGVIQDIKDKAFSSKAVKNWNDYIFYRAKYDSYTKILALVDMKINRGQKAQEELKRLKRG